MAVAISERKLTLREFLELEQRYPERKFRLNAAGGAVEVSPSRGHGFLQGEICSALLNWLRAGNLPGYGAGTEIMHDLDGWLCVPDVAVLPVAGEPIPVAPPLLAVEIRSESNPRSELREKARRYLAHGAQMVWLVYPETGALELYRADGTMQTLRGDERIEGGATLPGLSVAASALFPPQADRAR